jgi:hypothetical protein
MYVMKTNFWKSVHAEVELTSLNYTNVYVRVIVVILLCQSINFVYLVYREFN